MFLWRVQAIRMIFSHVHNFKPIWYSQLTAVNNYELNEEFSKAPFGIPERKARGQKTEMSGVNYKLTEWQIISN